MTAKRRHKDTVPHHFGGSWTDAKLRVLAAYLRSYTTALKDKPTSAKPFTKAFVDAFAGTGYRHAGSRKGESESPLFPDLAESEPQKLLAGSARLALEIKPRFDKFVFIEQRADRCEELEALKTEFPDLDPYIVIRHGDANDQIQKLCAANWKSHRAVLFLDPYGMQVHWETVEAIASTEAIDLWLLFPLGIGVNRLLTRTGDIPDSWRTRLNMLLGTEDWYDEFYRIETSPDLFGGEQERVIKATTDTIGRYFNERLKTLFPGVAPKPGVLRNSSNNPLYLLCFAAGNKRGAPVALRIANHLLKELQ